MSQRSGRTPTHQALRLVSSTSVASRKIANEPVLGLFGNGRLRERAKEGPAQGGRGNTELQSSRIDGPMDSPSITQIAKFVLARYTNCAVGQVIAAINVHLFPRGRRRNL